MEPFILLALAGGGALAVGLTARAKRRRRALIWRKCAETCGLTDLLESQGTLWARLRQAGGLDDVAVTIGEYHRGKKDRGTRIVLRTPDSRMAGLTLHAESVATDLRRMFGSSEIEVGDPEFDSAFFVGGQPGPSHAFLDCETRRRLLDLKGGCRRMKLAGGELTVDVREWRGGDLVSTLPPVLQQLLEIGRRWPHHSETAARVADNVRRDPQTGVRMQNLLALIHELPQDPITEPTLRAASADPWPEIRLQAGIALGPKGHDVLLALAEGREDDVPAAAIAALGPALVPERAMAILDNAIGTRRDRTAAACVAVLGRTGGDLGMARLARILLDGGFDYLKVAAAEALGASGRASAEAPLLGALRQWRLDVRRAAVAGLGQVGTVASVLPLQEAAARENSLRSTVRESIAAIQSRASGAAPGQLSISDADTGQLSLADHDAGRLSLPADERGRVALSGDEPAE